MYVFPIANIYEHMNIIFLCVNTHTNMSTKYSSSDIGSLGNSAYSG